MEKILPTYFCVNRSIIQKTLISDKKVFLKNSKMIYQIGLEN